MDTHTPLSQVIGGCLVLIVALGLLGASDGLAQDVAPGSAPLSPTLVADALVNADCYIAVCENRLTSAAKDYDLKAGENLMLSDFASRYSRNDVKFLFVIQPVKGDLDRIVVYDETAGFSKRPQLLPPPGARCIVLFRRSAHPKPPIVWKNPDGTVRKEMPVLEVVDKLSGAAPFDDSVQCKDEVEDLKTLAASVGKPAELQTLTTRLKSQLGRKVAERLKARSGEQK